MKWTRSACLALLSLALAAQAQDVRRTPLPPGHPLLGVWRLDVPGTNCHELYDVRADGTARITSGAQASSTEFEISATPSAKGFYTWMDKIVADNGKPDCTGEIMEIGHVVTNFILLHESGRMFLMCEREEMATCVGPFKRQGNGI